MRTIYHLPFKLKKIVGSWVKGNIEGFVSNVVIVREGIQSEGDTVKDGLGQRDGDM